MGKTFKDIRDFDVRRHKEQARETTKKQDLRTRVKPVKKKERKGSDNWRKYLETEE